MLENAVIRGSRSAYNNFKWVLNKNGAKTFRLVIDFKKLDAFSKTIKYPTAETSVIVI